MSKIKQVMRMMLQTDGRGRHPSNRKIAETIGLYKGTVNDYVKKIEADELGIEELLSLDDPILERRLCPGTAAYSDGRFDYMSDRMEYYLEELKRPHVTLQLLYEEYCGEVSNPYSYSQFCFHISQHTKASAPPSTVLSDQREGGKEMMVDFAGDKLHTVDADTGEVEDVELFVSTLPASDYPFAMAVASQRIEDFLLAHRRALEFYGGVPATVIPDNLKAAVTKADRYQPDVNRIYEDFCNHYGMVVIPARARKPKDKALVENHVRILYNRVYAALRNQVFHSLEELNAAIFDLMDRHRQKRMKQYNVTRQERFLAIDRPKLRPLPSTPFEIKCYGEYTVQKSSYIYLSQDKRYYSMPMRLIGQKVKVVYTPTILTAYHDGQPVAVHSRAGKKRYVTQEDHLPSYQNDYRELSPAKYIERAARISCLLGQVMDRLFQSNPLTPPETFYRSADGILHLARTCDTGLLETACTSALEYSVCTYAFMKNFISTGGKGLDAYTPDADAPVNSDTRGKGYYK